MIPQQIIAQKRDGKALQPEELRAFLQAYSDDVVGDDQMAAFLMAVYFEGLGPGELQVLLETMLNSGRILDFSHLPGPCVDKHSTGGVGDKVSLVLAPLAAEMGLFVPMMSGRGLGHTGGTLDKLESIPGFNTQISLERFSEVLASVGCAMIGQTDEIAPLDRRLYALRDITGTVPSIPLITASIMSKKLAEGLTGLVLDVKVGSGAFLPDLDDAKTLAQTMVAVGAGQSLPVTAVLSAMDQPLGAAVGNRLEVAEAMDCLQGGGPGDLRELTIRLAAEMAMVGRVASDLDEGLVAAEKALDGGGAMERFARLVAAQGGPTELNAGAFGPTAPSITEVPSPSAGTVTAIDTRGVGYGLIGLGGGRTRQDQTIDPRVGFVMTVRVGDTVRQGQPLAIVHAGSEEAGRRGAEAVAEAVQIGESDEGHPLPLVLDRIS